MGLLDDYKRRVTQSGKYMGDALKNQSDIIMDKTFTRDIAYRKCYINGHEVDAKYIVHTYYSINADQVDYHIQFRPGVHYPIGTYIDIPDDVGEYHRWLLVERSDEPQFPKYSALKCNWTLRWIKDGVIYECLGVLRSQSSYNSGLWTDYYMTRPENQEKVWLPTNSVTRTLTYNQRVLLGDWEGDQDPAAWEISKIENVQPVGITRITLYQSKYDPARDNKELMLADYYASERDPVTTKQVKALHRKPLQIKCTIPPQIKVGGSYKKFSAYSPELAEDEYDTSLITWKIEGLSEEDYVLSQKEDKPEEIKIKSARNYSLIGTVFEVQLYYDGTLEDKVQVEVASL